MSVPRFGYKRQRRISKQQDIRTLLSRGERLRRGSLRLYWRRRGSGPARAGVIMAARWQCSKPERNRRRRQYREAMRILLPELSAGVDVLVGLEREAESKRTARSNRKVLDPRGRLREVLSLAGLLREDALL